MPTYPYICPAGHSTAIRRERELRHEPGACGTCGESARYRHAPQAAPPMQVVATYTFRCDRCSHRFPVKVNLGDDPTALDRPRVCGAVLVLTEKERIEAEGEGEREQVRLVILTDEDGNLQTRTCDGEARPEWSAAIADFFTRTYPGGYFDQGLGVFIRDAQHRQAEMDRLGVVEMGPDWQQTIDRAVREQTDGNEKIEREYDELVVDMKRQRIDAAIMRAHDSGKLAEMMQTATYHGHGATWTRHDEVARYINPRR